MVKNPKSQESRRRRVVNKYEEKKVLYFFLIRKKNYALNNVPFIGEALRVRTFVINPSDVTESDTNDYVHFSGSLPQDSLRLPLGERGLTAFPLNNGMKEHDPNLFLLV